MKHAKLVSTLLAAYFRFSAALSSQLTEDERCMLHVLYSSTIGIIMYVMVCIRLDISLAVSVVS